MFYLHCMIQASDSGGGWHHRVEIFSTDEKFGEYLQYKLGGKTAAIGMVNNPDQLPPELHQIWVDTHAVVDEGVLHFFIHTMPNGKKVDVFAPHNLITLATGKDVGWWWMPTGVIPQQRHGPYKTKDEAYMQAIITNQ